MVRCYHRLTSFHMCMTEGFFCKLEYTLTNTQWKLAGRWIFLVALVMEHHASCIRPHLIPVSRTVHRHPRYHGSSHHFYIQKKIKICQFFNAQGLGASGDYTSSSWFLIENRKETRKKLGLVRGRGGATRTRGCDKDARGTGAQNHMKKSISHDIRIGHPLKLPIFT